MMKGKDESSLVFFFFLNWKVKSFNKNNMQEDILALVRLYILKVLQL